ncbi:type II toxin-antitoxin system HicB family antitoxin [Capnocytophaga canimorsus]|uniref:type II toxin-antitoxin system HicB family antitoxin n=1 Tax=Capnocytophaga canimorsus TaxID=28188 RepID=UPI0037D948F5
MEIRLILEKSATGYSAYSEDLKGVATAGETIEEVKENFKEALDLQVDYLEEEGKTAEATELRNAKVVYYLNLNTFFEYYSLFNKSELAKYLGINPSHLRRLSGTNIELSEKKALQIQNGLHKLADDLKQICFA